jgi:hypothetical protein
MLKRAFTWLANQSERWPWLVLSPVFSVTVITFHDITRIERDFDFQKNAGASRCEAE